MLARPHWIGGMSLLHISYLASWLSPFHWAFFFVLLPCRTALAVASHSVLCAIKVRRSEGRSGGTDFLHGQLPLPAQILEFLGAPVLLEPRVDPAQSSSSKHFRNLPYCMQLKSNARCQLPIACNCIMPVSTLHWSGCRHRPLHDSSALAHSSDWS